MTVMILKNRAKKPLIISNHPTCGLYPNGVGGIDGNKPAFQIGVGDYSIFITKTEWEVLGRRFLDLEENT